MRGSRILTGAIVTISVAVASVFAAAPASAATLPSGQRIDTVDYYTLTTYTADPATAALTQVGADGTDAEYIVEGVDVDDDGHGYAIGANESGGFVYSFDANTGLVSNPLPVDINFQGGAIPSEDCEGIDYTGGVLYGVCYAEIDEDYTAFIGVLTLPDGELTWELEPFTIDDERNFSSIAVDPTSGIIYGFSTAAQIFTLSEDLDPVFQANMPYVAFGADFDRDGKLWVTTYIDSPYKPALATVNAITGASDDAEHYSVDGVVGEYESESITVWGKAALPATGPADSSVPLAGAALLLLLGGTILAGVTVLRRQREV